MSAALTLAAIGGCVWTALACLRAAQRDAVQAWQDWFDDLLPPC